MYEWSEKSRLGYLPPSRIGYIYIEMSLFCFPCFRSHDDGDVRKRARKPQLDLRDICFPGTWFEEALEAQRKVFSYSETNGVSISEGRLSIGIQGHFVNYIVAKGSSGTEALDLRLAVRTGMKNNSYVPPQSAVRGGRRLGGEVLYRPGTTAVEGRPLGRVLVLLASWGTGIGTFSQCLPALVDHFEAVYCLDLPGMGLSSRWYPDNASDDVSPIAIDVATEFDNALAFALNQLAELDATYKIARTRVLAAHSLSCGIAARAVVKVNSSQVDQYPIHVLVWLSPIGIPRTNINISSSSLHEGNVADLSRPGRAMRKIHAFCVRKGFTPQLLLRLWRRSKMYTVFHDLMRTHFTSRHMPEDMFRYLFILNRVPRGIPRGGERLIYDIFFNAEEDGQVADVLEGAKGVLPVVRIYGERDIAAAYGFTTSDAGSESIDSDGRIVRIIDDSKHFSFVENVPEFSREFIESFREAMQWISQRSAAGRNL